MKIHTTDGLFVIDAPHDGIVTARWACMIMADKPLMSDGGYLHRIADLPRRMVGGRIEMDEEIDHDGEYFFVRTQPVDA